MFNVIIKETQERHTLELIDPDTGINCIEDFIDDATDDAFDYDDDQCVYTCNQTAFDWWAKVIADTQRTDDRVYALKQEHGYEALMLAVESAGAAELEDRAATINAALDEAFGPAL